MRRKGTLSQTRSMFANPARPESLACFTEGSCHPDFLGIEHLHLQAPKRKLMTSKQEFNSKRHPSLEVRSCAPISGARIDITKKPHCQRRPASGAAAWACVNITSALWAAGSAPGIRRAGKSLPLQALPQRFRHLTGPRISYPPHINMQGPYVGAVQSPKFLAPEMAAVTRGELRSRNFRGTSAVHVSDNKLL